MNRWCSAKSCRQDFFFFFFHLHLNAAFVTTKGHEQSAWLVFGVTDVQRWAFSESTIKQFKFHLTCSFNEWTCEADVIVQLGPPMWVRSTRPVKLFAYLRMGCSSVGMTNATVWRLRAIYTRAYSLYDVMTSQLYHSYRRVTVKNAGDEIIQGDCNWHVM